MLRNNFCSLILAVILFQITYGERFTECDNKQPGTYEEDLNNCLVYIYCDNDNSAKAFCPNESPYFSKNDMDCVSNENVCGNRPKTTTTITTITTTTPKPITNNTNGLVECPATEDPNNPIFIANNKSCSEYFLCFHGQPMAMHCANMLQFDMKQQRCDLAENVKCQVF